MADWDPELYLRFQSERDKPAMDLIGNIELDRPGRIIDLGCGPGNSTLLLKARWPDAEVIGIDCSPSMIGKAREACPGGSFIVADMCRDLKDLGRFDIVFANASLQWISDQAGLISRLFGLIGPQGVLAAQIPQFDQMRISGVIREVVASSRWSSSLGEIDPGFHFHPDASYYEWFSGPGTDVRMWATEYYHVMDGHDRIIDMMRSTGLRTYLGHLGADDVPHFLRSIKEGLERAYPRQKDGKVLFPFKRLFVLARKV
jgi:trans-aconitate 2-methyltransferase